MRDDPTARQDHGQTAAHGPGTAPSVVYRVGRYPTLSETFVQAQIDGLRRRRCRVDILADRAADAPAQGTVTALAPRSDALARLFDRLPHAIRRRGAIAAERRAADSCDAVVCNFGWFGASVADAVAGRRRRAALAVIFHGDDMSRMLRGAPADVYDTVFREADLLLPISRFWRDRLIGMGAPADRTHVHRMGVDTARLAFAPRGAQDGPLRILTVGRLVEKKGTAPLLQALARLRRTRPGLDMALSVIGDGPLRAPLERLTEDLGLTGHVAFHGACAHADILARLRGADIFVLPSVTARDGDMEGIPVSLMEAMAVGVPVVSTRHSGIPELVAHGDTGLLADERDVDDLSAQLLALGDAPDLRRRLAGAARARVERDFDTHRQDDRLLALLRDAIACRRARAARTAPADA